MFKTGLRALAARIRPKAQNPPTAKALSDVRLHNAGERSYKAPPGGRAKSHALAAKAAEDLYKTNI